ncbi:hypothetical protein BJX63DRAFT_428017 [Aspergillus granulosus]|uniref:Major facilitator superfamily (MFS) profile domain-containing protein n=1 Tax=Aspergillus granulosus TaxID=176169 RepID=A0ABR4HYY3_9EURO
MAATTENSQILCSIFVCQPRWRAEDFAEPIVTVLRQLNEIEIFTILLATAGHVYFLTKASIVSVLLATVLWSAYVKSSGEWYANRILMGIFNAPVKTLVEILVTDLSFTHERGVYMSVYTWTSFNGAFLAPIAGGYTAQSIGWQWIQCIGTIIGVATTVLMFFCFEESMFFRKTTSVEFLQSEAGKALDEESPPDHLPVGEQKTLDNTKNPALDNITTGDSTPISQPNHSGKRYLLTVRL